ncbi:hypothetical protein F5Y06DRAFT_300053 [Hypoxylon sp. FL0890]|nr:hypothetical protein F5Y06DRAFT_300053 [Hypoxylon sp. FL0890]
MLFFKLYFATFLAGAFAAPVTNEGALTERETIPDSASYSPLIYARPKEEKRAD